MKTEHSGHDELTREKSLEIIHQMINQAKTNINDSGLGWLLWGSMIFLACLSTYILIEIKYPFIFLGWNIFGLVTIIILAYQALKRRSKVVRTYIDDLLRLFDLGFIISLFIIILSINLGVSPNYGFGYFLMIYAFLMLIQGGVMKFRPLIIGAVVNWAAAIAVFINMDFKYDMLISAAAVFIGYIIPGLILRSQYKLKQ